MTEDMTPVPEDSYGIAKLAIEQELRVSHEMFGLAYTIFRPHNVYGERQNIGDRYRNVVGIFMNQLSNGEAMTIFGDGQQERAFTHIGDIAPIIAESIEFPAAQNEIFNVGADVPFTVNELATIVADAIGSLRNVRHLEVRKEVKCAFSDHSKALTVFGTRRKTPLDEGIRNMASWVSAHGARASGPYKDIEIARNLPPSWIPAQMLESVASNGLLEQEAISLGVA